MDQRNYETKNVPGCWRTNDDLPSFGTRVRGMGKNQQVKLAGTLATVARSHSHHCFTTQRVVCLRFLACVSVGVSVMFVVVGCERRG